MRQPTFAALIGTSALALLFSTGQFCPAARADGEQSDEMQQTDSGKGDDSSKDKPAESDQSKTEASGDAEKKDADAGATSGTVLRGGVRGAAIKLEQGLNMIESSSKMVQGSALQLAKECTRKEQTVFRGPNYIGNGIVLPAIGGSGGSGIVDVGELPARKDKAEAFLSTCEEAMKALRSHVDGLIIPEGSPEEMANLWHGMQSSMQAAETNIGNMRAIVSQIPSKKNEIKQKDAKPLGRAALKVYDSITALEKMRKKLDGMAKKEAKSKRRV